MKAIVILDEMPIDCKECPCIDYEEGYCKVDKYLRQCGWTKNKKSDWCPLRPLPSKRHIPITKTFGTPFNVGKAKGWNACLDAITGETE